MLILLLSALTGNLSASADYLPSPQRFEATRQTGHNAETDESARGCRLDYVRMKDPDGSSVLLFYAWSDFASRISFVGALPAGHFPLREGATWEYFGKSYRYQNGWVENVDGSFRMEVDRLLVGPTAFEGLDIARPEHRLSCEF